MPRIPAGVVSDAQLPSSGGIQSPRVPIPAGQQEGVSLQTGLAGEQALAGLGEQISQAGQFVVQAEAFQQQRHRAQGVLDGTLGTQDFAQQLQAGVAQLEQRLHQTDPTTGQPLGDYRTLPEDVQRLGRQLQMDIAHARGLKDVALARFRTDAEQAITVAQGKALGVQSKRMGEESLFAMGQTVQEHQEAVAGATTEADRMMAEGRLLSNIQGFVSVGLLGGTEGATLYQKTLLGGRQLAAERAIEGDPVARHTELWGMTQGQAPTTEAFKNLPPTMLPMMVTKAAEKIREQAGLIERDTRVKLAARKATQSKNMREVWSALSMIPATPENVPALQQQLQRIQTLVQQGGLDDDDSKSSLKWALDLREKASAFVKPDNELVKTRLVTMLMFSDTPAELREMRDTLATYVPDLSSATLMDLMQKLDSRENTLNPLNFPEFHQARQRLLDYMGVGGVTTPGQAAHMLESAEGTQLRDGLLALQDQFIALGQVDPRAAKQQWKTMADDIIDQYLLHPGGRQSPPRMSGLYQPLATGGPKGGPVLTIDEVDRILASDRRLSDAERGRYRKEWLITSKTPVLQRWIQEQAGGGPAPAPAAAPTSPTPAPPAPGSGVLFQRPGGG